MSYSRRPGNSFWVQLFIAFLDTEDLLSNFFNFFFSVLGVVFLCFSPWEHLVWLVIMTIQRQLKVASRWYYSSLSTFELICKLLIFSLSQPIFTKSVFLAPNLSGLSGLGFLIADCIGKDWDKEGIKYLILLYDSCHQFPCSIQHWAHIFLLLFLYL